MHDSWHPSPEDLARFAGNDLPPRDTAKVEGHLALCLSCKWQLEDLLSRATGALLGWQASEDSYRRVIERTFEKVAGPFARAVQEAESAPLLLAELLQRPQEERRRILRERKFQTVKLCQLLQAKSRESWYRNAEAALAFSELAVAIAGWLDPVAYSARLVEDVRARAWAYYGNSLRLSADFGAAEKALRRARSHSLRAGEEIHTECEILSFLASLHADRCEYDRALSLADHLLVLSRETDDSSLEAATLIQKGSWLDSSGCSRRALTSLRRALLLLEEHENLTLAIAARQNLAAALLSTRDLRGCLEIVEENRGLFRQAGVAAALTRLRWLEGLISKELGRFEEAQTAFRIAREGLASGGFALGAATVSLELALLYPKVGSAAEIRRLLKEIIPVFEATRLSRYTLAARVLFERVSQR